MVQELQTISAEPITGMPGETLRIGVDFTLYGLDPSELLTGIPTAVDPTGVLIPANVQVNTAAFINKRKKIVAIGKGVIFSCPIPANIVSGTDFSLLVAADTNGSPAQHLIGRCPIWVRSID